MLHYDQLNAIAKHIQQEPHMETMPIVRSIVNTAILQHELGQSFKLTELKKQPDWPEWQKARYKILDYYLDQNMLSDPMERSKDANIHHMLWQYTIKMCGK